MTQRARVGSVGCRQTFPLRLRRSGLVWLVTDRVGWAAITLGVYVPDTRVVFAGDLLFVGIHPVIHSGPVSGWIAACELMLTLDADTIVPGHGPIVGPAAVRAFREYLLRMYDHAQMCREAGRTVLEAAADFDFIDWPQLRGPERVLLEVGAIYREYGSVPSELELLTMLPTFIGTLARKRRCITS